MRRRRYGMSLRGSDGVPPEYALAMTMVRDLGWPLRAGVGDSKEAGGLTLAEHATEAHVGAVSGTAGAVETTGRRCKQRCPGLPSRAQPLRRSGRAGSGPTAAAQSGTRRGGRGRGGRHGSVPAPPRCRSVGSSGRRRSRSWCLHRRAIESRPTRRPGSAPPRCPRELAGDLLRA